MYNLTHCYTGHAQWMSSVTVPIYHLVEEKVNYSTFVECFLDHSLWKALSQTYPNRGQIVSAACEPCGRFPFDGLKFRFEFSEISRQQRANYMYPKF